MRRTSPAAFIAILAATFGLAVCSRAETLDQEASRLYEKHRVRMTGIKTVRLEYRLSIEQSTLAVGRDPAPLTRVGTSMVDKVAGVAVGSFRSLVAGVACEAALSLMKTAGGLTGVASVISANSTCLKKEWKCVKSPFGVRQQG